MNKGKTYYQFQINCQPEAAIEIINLWIKENNFVYTNKYGEGAFLCKDAFYGKCGFQYNVTEQVVNIYAWICGVGKKTYMLDTGYINNMVGDHYKQLINILFNNLSNLSVNGDAAYSSVFQTQDVTQVAEKMKQDTAKKSETLCEVAFWISILGVVLAFFGYTVGVIIYIFDFYAASKGIKTRKKVKAIVTFVLSGLSIAMVLFWIILSYALA